MPMDQAVKEMKPKSEFLFLAEELQCYILSFLPWQDILRCTSVCKALRQTYMTSSELQYAIELGGQRLLHVPNMNVDNHTSIATRLQLLRDKAYAWLNFNNRSFKTISIPRQLRMVRKIVADGYICLWEAPWEGDNEPDTLRVFPVLHKPSQRTIERNWSPKLFRSIPNTRIISVFMDPAQNLIAIAYTIRDDTLQSDDESFHDFYIDLRTLDGDGVHPEAAGPMLFPTSEMPHDNGGVKGQGRHIAFWRSPRFTGAIDISYKGIWSLQIWDWQNSTTSNSILYEPTNSPLADLVNFHFLGNDRLLIVNKELKLYSIEDMSQAPQLLARFLLPFSALHIHLRLPIEGIPHSSALHMQAQQTMWTSDPKHRLLCLDIYHRSQNFLFIISSNIFFDLDVLEATAAPIPWETWGPSNARIFCHQHPCLGLNGNRVLLFLPAIDKPTDMKNAMNRRSDTKYRLHLMDFTPLAVERRQGLGRMVKEPSITQVPGSEENTMTFLPYVEIASDRIFTSYELCNIWVDKDGILLLTDGDDDAEQLEVMDM